LTPPQSNSLFAEKIGLGFFGERGFQDSSASAADSARVRESEGFGVAAGVLFDGQKARSAAPSVKDFTHAMARSFWRDMETSMVVGGLMVPKRILKPCANISVLPGLRCGAIDSL